MEESAALFYIGPVPVTGTVVTTWVIIALLALVSWLATRRLSDIPGPMQTIAELAVGGLENFFSGILSRDMVRKYFPMFATLFIFIIVSNYTGILPGAGKINGFSVPTASLSVTAGLALIAFTATHTIGVKEVGWKKYLKSFIKPFILMLPLNLIEQVVRPLSLALRLYGNLFGEESVTHQMYNILPILLPLVMNVLSVLLCFIQAMVFTMLFAIYVEEALESGNE